MKPAGLGATGAGVFLAAGLRVAGFRVVFVAFAAGFLRVFGAVVLVVGLFTPLDDYLQ